MGSVAMRAMEITMSSFSISIAKDFTGSPGGRYREDGDYSGEQFRDDLLIPSLQKYDHVTVQLDGTAGYPSSFLEEAFGGLIRCGGFTRSDLNHQLDIKNEDPHYDTYRILAERYIREAEPMPARA
jgi:hypothetical protein